MTAEGFLKDDDEVGKQTTRVNREERKNRVKVVCDTII